MSRHDGSRPSRSGHAPSQSTPTSAVQCSATPPNAKVPQSQDWEEKRSVISQLYFDKEWPLKDVQEYMERVHGFKATKRMYMTRFRKWQIKKNYRASEKEALAARIAQAHAEDGSVKEIQHNNRPVKVDRILRHCKTILRKRQKEQGSKMAARDSTATPLLPATTVRMASIQAPIPRPTRSLNPPVEGSNVELILFSIHILSQNQLSSPTPTPAASQFWTSIKSAIHFLKKSSPHLAFPLLNTACQTPHLIASLSHSPVHFLRELFTTLSPVSTKSHAAIRLHLLQYLHALSKFRLKPTHPICSILHQLTFDTGTIHASETCLRYQVFLQRRPPHVETSPDLDAPTPAPVSEINFQLTRSLSTLLRRDHNYSNALTILTDLVRSCVATFGQDHHFTNTARLDLVHVYSDRCDYARGIEICADILSSYQNVQGPTYPDSRASYAMEAMAELHYFGHDHEKEEYWLRQALHGARKNRGEDDESTHFVKGKLDASLTRQGRQGEIDSWAKT